MDFSTQLYVFRQSAGNALTKHFSQFDNPTHCTPTMKATKITVRDLLKSDWAKKFKKDGWAFVEIVILIPASSSGVFDNRVASIHKNTKLFFLDVEQDEEAPLFKTVFQAEYPTIGDLKLDFNWLTTRKWFFPSECAIVVDGQTVFSDGEWILTF